VILVATLASATTTVGFGTGLDARLGKGAVFIGYGAGPSFTQSVGEHWDVHGEGRLLVLAGASGLLRAGVGVHLTRGSWQPGAALDLGLFLGASLRAVTAENPELAPDVAPVLQLRLDPVRFVGETWSAELLRMQVGAGWDRGRPAPAFGVTVVEIGARY
jgi:hypothetical protein